MDENSRRHFIRKGGYLMLGTILGKNLFAGYRNTQVDAHIWVYASRYPPDWDCFPILDNVFSDLKSAGFDGVEIMESILRHEGSVNRLNDLVGQYKLPVSGTSYYADMWNQEEKEKILDDISSVLEKLKLAGGKMIGLTVGDARRIKTEKELDTQAEVLKRIITIAAANGILPHLHNHTFEVTNGLYDLKGTLARLPEIKLGPDINWLIRAGVDPVWFIKTYGKQIVYMHIRDQDKMGKWTEALGEGTTDFKKIAKALRQIHYNGRMAVELAFDKPPVREIKEDWRMSRNYIRKNFGR